MAAENLREEGYEAVIMGEAALKFEDQPKDFTVQYRGDRYTWELIRGRNHVSDVGTISSSWEQVAYDMSSTIRVKFGDEREY